MARRKKNGGEEGAGRRDVMDSQPKFIKKVFGRQRIKGMTGGKPTTLSLEGETHVCLASQREYAPHNIFCEAGISLIIKNATLSLAFAINTTVNRSN